MNKNTKYVVIFFALSVLFMPVYADNSIIDSLRQKLQDAPAAEKIDILNEISRAYWSVSLETSIEYASEALALAESLNDKKGIADAINRLGNAEHQRMNYDDALNHYKHSLNIRIDIGD